jgi:hypothetical protein
LRKKNELQIKILALLVSVIENQYKPFEKKGKRENDINAMPEGGVPLL